MKQCLKITFLLPGGYSFIQKLIQRQARQLELEGVAQIIDSHQVQIVACGSKEAIEQLIDAIYQGNETTRPENVAIEPFIQEPNFRGVFRVLE